jgi:hypothetical protein
MDATSDAIGEPLNCEVETPGAGMRSPEMKRKSLLPGATGERKASLLRGGFSADAADAGDVQALHACAQVTLCLRERKLGTGHVCEHCFSPPTKRSL